MLPVIALVGRPNVGKSTLFNSLTRTRDALVADTPGLTRDRQYGFAENDGRAFLVVDTGGLSGNEDGLDGLMAAQTLRAVDEADAVLFIVDGREGRTAADDQVAAILRRRGKPVWLTVNKTEGLETDIAAADFQALGMGRPWAIAAAHGSGTGDLLEAVLEGIGPDRAGEAEVAAASGALRVAVIGRPNVGKSTLINRLLGEDRVLAFDAPGTTRDAVAIPFRCADRDYTLIDTAGMRRRARVSEKIERFSAIKALQAVDSANVVIALLDAREGVTDQDVSLLATVLERGRALVLTLNKWDGLNADQRTHVQRSLDLKLPFLDFAPVHYISALHGTGVGHLMQAVDRAYSAATREMPTPELNRVLEQAVSENPPPGSAGRRPRLRYAHQGGRNPPVIVIHGTRTGKISESYRRFLVRRFRERFNLQGTPVRILFKMGENPFAGKRNRLTPRQDARRKRMMRHVKKK